MEIVLSCLLTLLVTCLVFLLLMTSSSSRGCSQIPGPRYWGGIGAALTFVRFLLQGVPEAASHYASIYGDFVRVWISGVPTYLISRPSLANHIMKTNGNNYTMRFGNEEGLVHIGMWTNGIIWNRNVSNWRLLRTFFQRAVNASNLNRAVTVAAESTDKCLQTLTSQSRDRLEMLDFLRRITLDVTNTLTLGVRIDNDEKFVAKIVDYFKAWEYFLLKPPWTYRLFGAFNKHIAAVHALNDAVDELIAKKRLAVNCCEAVKPVEEAECSGAHAQDFTFWLLEAEAAGEVTSADVRQCLLEMFLAGTDTSSVNMYYALVAIAADPRIDRRIYQELQQVLGNRELTRYDLPKLVYLEAVLKETMRVKPVGPVVLRCAINDDVIEGFPVPAGTQVIVHLARMHRRPATFDQPDQFNPERFLEEDSRSPCEYMPFGTGPRGCVGQFLAMIEMKSVMSTLLRRYRVIPAAVDTGASSGGGRRGLSDASQSLDTLTTRWDIAQQPTTPTHMRLVPRIEIDSS